MHSFKKVSKAVLVIAVCTAILILLDTALYPCTFMRNDVHTVATQEFDDIIVELHMAKWILIRKPWKR